MKYVLPRSYLRYASDTYQVIPKSFISEAFEYFNDKLCFLVFIM